MSSEKNPATEMWNQRYAQEEYVYGIQPNEFLKQTLAEIKPGKILLPAEGEGRNAIFAAQQGWKVTAFDSSEQARKKAMKLAEDQNATINYLISSMEEFKLKENSFDVIALIYAHNANREENHKRIVRFLKPGGTIILEGFSKNQIDKKSGGPKALNFLFSVEELKNDFAELQIITIEESEVDLSEGSLHVGTASVVRVIATK